MRRIERYFKAAHTVIIPPTTEKIPGAQIALKLAELNYLIAIFANPAKLASSRRSLVSFKAW